MVISVLIVILRQAKPEMGLAATIAAGVILMAAVLVRLAPVIDELSGLIASTSAAGYIPVVFKAFGICVVTQLAADICRDAGQQTVASNVEIAGRLAMFAAALPLLSSVLTTAVEIING